MTLQKMELDVEPLAGHIGAVVRGIDLAEPLDEATIAAIRALWLKHKVIFFRDQDIGPQQHLEFARRFGELEPGHPTIKPAFPEYPEILVLDSENIFERTDEDGTVPEFENHWHTDVTFSSEPPIGAVLRGVIVPEYGGDTQWLNLETAYEKLSPKLREMLDGLTAVHENGLSLARGVATPHLQRTFVSKKLRCVHPVVRVHPETGKRALFVNPNFTSHIVELSRQESRHILALLYEHMSNPEFTVRFRWRPGSIAFWDNRSTAHLIPGDVPEGTRRQVQRVTLKGEPTVGVSGVKSYPLEAA